MEGKWSQGVNTVMDCWEWCLDTNGCQAVSFNEAIKVCQLKSKSDGTPTSDTSYASIRLNCLMNTAEEMLVSRLPFQIPVKFVSYSLRITDFLR